ncbi:MAG: branched chain amino acid aminotransferase, partial [Acidobacteriota bacterium]|nr:branched chain amino acid aminotransferase [Acidobacteriota bacterium]
MAFAGTGKIWMNGSLVDWQDATIHVASHALHYGTGVFEGIRAYDSKTGTNIFRLEPHMRRLMDSCRVYRMEPRWSQAELSQAVLDTVR